MIYEENEFSQARYSLLCIQKEEVKAEKQTAALDQKFAREAKGRRCATEANRSNNNRYSRNFKSELLSFNPRRGLAQGFGPNGVVLQSPV